MKKSLFVAVMLAACLTVGSAQANGYPFPVSYWDALGAQEWARFTPIIKHALVTGFLAGSQAWLLGIGASETQTAFDGLASTVEVDETVVIQHLDNFYARGGRDNLAMPIIRIAAQLRGRW